MLENDELYEGEMIPTELALCTLFDVSRSTVQKALSELVEEGYLFRIKGHGTFISQKKYPHNYSSRMIFTNRELYQGDESVNMRVLELETLRANIDISHHLKLPTHTEIINLIRLGTVNNEPQLIHQVYLQRSLCEFITKYDLSKVSLYEVLSTKPETRIYRFNHNIEAYLPTTLDCSLLGITKATPILMVKSYGYNKFDIPIHYTITKYRSDSNIITLDQEL